MKHAQLPTSPRLSTVFPDRCPCCSSVTWNVEGRLVTVPNQMGTELEQVLRIWALQTRGRNWAISLGGCFPYKRGWLKAKFPSTVLLRHSKESG